jgi:chromosome partitioning protein
MSFPPDKNKLQRIVILNPKGGCGKTSVATNLASYFASCGPVPTLIDCDPLGGSTHWLEKRSKMRPRVHGIAAFKPALKDTHPWQLSIPSESRKVIVDTPAGLPRSQIFDLIYDADNVLIPVLPSPIDIHYAARFIADLLLAAQLDIGSVRVGIVANRTRQNTSSLKQLLRFLGNLKIPLISVLRDSQSFVFAANEGIGICDLPPSRARLDLEGFSKITSWLAGGERSPVEHPASTVPTIGSAAYSRLIH